MRLPRATRTMGALGAGFLSLWGPGAVAQADPLPFSAEHVQTPGRSVASDDTADAIVLNPANLAFLPAPELRYT